MSWQNNISCHEGINQMHSAVPQSHYEWPRCSQATHEIQLTSNANRKIGITICNPEENGGSVRGTVTMCFLLRGMNWEDGTASLWSSWTDINIFSYLALHEMEKGHIKVLIKFTKSSIQSPLKHEKRLKRKGVLLRLSAAISVFQKPLSFPTRKRKSVIDFGDLYLPPSTCR